MGEEFVPQPPASESENNAVPTAVSGGVAVLNVGLDAADVAIKEVKRTLPDTPQEENPSNEPTPPLIPEAKNQPTQEQEPELAGVRSELAGFMPPQSESAASTPIDPVSAPTPPPAQPTSTE